MAFSVTFLISPDVIAKTSGKDSLAFDRGLSFGSEIFVPKGTIMSGLSFSYSNYDMDDFKFLMAKGINASVNMFGIAPQITYFVRNNLSVGARFDYNSHNVAINKASLDISEDLGFELSNLNSIERSYHASATMRYYMPFSGSRRFGLFTEVRLTGGYGQSKNYEQIDVNKFGTYQEMLALELGLIPGLTVFFTNEVAFEVSVGVLGFNYKMIKQYTNQVYEGTYEHSGANFRVNLLNINFGITYFIPVKNK